MTAMTAMILAAGLGVRMGPRGRLTPKGLIEVGGIPMVAQSVATLRGWGAARIVIVTGHLHDQYETLFGGSDVDLIHNPDYATTGSLLTLATGLAKVDGPLVIAESDLIYAPEALTPLGPHTNRFMVSGPTGAGDEVYVWTQDNSTPPTMDVIAKTRDTRAAEPLGEMVGLTGLTARAVDTLRDVADEILRQTPAEHYEASIVALSQKIAMECYLIPDLPWAEIDDEAMLERAERLVYPRVVAARAASGLQI